MAGISAKRRMIAAASSSWTSIYQPVEYIESTGTQYLKITDTYYPGEAISLTCQSGETSSTTIIAAYATYAGRWFGTGGGVYSIGGGNNFSASCTNKTTVGIVYGDTEMSVTVGIETLSRTYANTDPLSLTLFAGMQGDSEMNYYTSAKIYGFTMASRFDLRPCYRKSDNVIGMYDTVSGTFFTNLGTGTFLKGADI